MSIRFQNQYFTFHKLLEVHNDMGNPSHSYTKFTLSSSRKRPDTGERIYSDWIATARGDVVNTINSLVKGDFISCNGVIERVPYTQDEKKKWPEATIVIFQAEKYVRPEEEKTFTEASE